MTSAVSMTVAASAKATMPMDTYYGCLPETRVQGADVSQWQAKTSDPRVSIDFEKMKLQGVQFVYVRVACKGAYDAEFQQSWASAKKNGLIRGAYIALDYRASIPAQIQKSVNWLIDDPGELPIALDFEKLLYAGLGSAKALERLKGAVELIDATFGKKCIIYTNPDAIINFINWIPGWFLTHDLWIAHYGVTTLGPSVGYQYFTKSGLPKGGFRFWQYTDRGDGIAHGCQSKQIDLDWWNGTRAELLDYCKLAPDPEVPVVPKNVEERVTALEQRVGRLESRF